MSCEIITEKEGFTFFVSVTKYLRSNNGQGVEAHLAHSAGTGESESMYSTVTCGAPGRGLLAACIHGRSLAWWGSKWSSPSLILLKSLMPTYESTLKYRLILITP